MGTPNIPPATTPGKPRHGPPPSRGERVCYRFAKNRAEDVVLSLRHLQAGPYIDLRVVVARGSGGCVPTLRGFCISARLLRELEQGLASVAAVLREESR